MPTDSNTVTSSVPGADRSTADELGEIGHDVLRSDRALRDGDQEVARLRERDLARLDHDPRATDRLRVQLALIGQVGAHRIDVRPLARATARRTADTPDVVHVQTMSASATLAGSPTDARTPVPSARSARVRATSGVRETTTTSSTGATAAHRLEMGRRLDAGPEDHEPPGVGVRQEPGREPARPRPSGSR